MDTATTRIYTLSLHDALPISALELGIGEPPQQPQRRLGRGPALHQRERVGHHHGAESAVLLIGVDDLDGRSEEHTSELQSQSNLVCRLLLEKKKEVIVLCYST